MELPVPSPHVLARTPLAALALLAALPAAASAASTRPPQARHVVTAFPGRDIVRLVGFEPGRSVEVRVLRGAAKVPVATATGTTDAGGSLEINRSRAHCWDDVTPDLIAGDTIVVADRGAPPAGGEAMTVRDLEAFPPLLERDPDTDVPTGRVIVRGTARNPDGSPMDLADLEQRIVNPALERTAIGRRAVTVTGGAGLSADPAVPGGFVAVHGPYEPAVAALLVDGETTIRARQGDGDDRRGLTVGEVGAVGGPAPGCPALADYAVTATDPEAVTAAGPLRVSGIAQDATAVEVTLSDGTTTMPARAARPTPAAGAQTWSVELTAADVAALADGRLTATAAYTVEGGGRLGGRPLTIVKDTAAPAPRAGEGTPTPGMAEMLRAVAARNRLALAERGAQAGGR